MNKHAPCKLNSNMYTILPLDQFKSVVEPVQVKPFRGEDCSFLTLDGDPLLASALLFQAAITLCGRHFRVLYIAVESLQRLPPPVHGMPSPDPVCMQLAQFVYLSSVDAMVTLLSDAHRWRCPPQAVLIDLTSIPPAAVTPARLWRLEAGLREAVSYLSTVHSRSSAADSHSSASDSRSSAADGRSSAADSRSSAADGRSSAADSRSSCDPGAGNTDPSGSSAVCAGSGCVGMIAGNMARADGSVRPVRLDYGPVSVRRTSDSAAQLLCGRVAVSLQLSMHSIRLTDVSVVSAD